MQRARLRRGLAALAAGTVLLSLCVRPASALPSVPPAPPPGSFEWLARELDNWRRAHGRSDEQQATPGYAAAVDAEVARLQARFWVENASVFAGRPRLTATMLLTPLFVGDPWRNEVSWHGTHERFFFLNRWGAKLAADLWGPADLFTVGGRRPTVVVTTGSIQGNARMYWWAAQLLADAGYVVLTYDVQGQGESETFGHHADSSFWCDGAGQPADVHPFLKELTACPGFPFQQSANFAVGAVDAHNLAVSTPDAPYEHRRAGTGTVSYLPWHAYVDPARVGAAGHSLGAAAVSFVQAHPEMLSGTLRAIVAWDSLSPCSAYEGPAGPPTGSRPCLPVGDNVPRVPALNLTNDYMFPLVPGMLATGFGTPSAEGRRGGFDRWRHEGVETASIVLRGGTHLEYTSTIAVPLLFSATKHGQDLAAHYTLAWFDRYLRDDASAATRILARDVTFTHRSPTGVPEPSPTTLDVADFASFYYDSAVSVDGTCFLDWAAEVAPC